MKSGWFVTLFAVILAISAANVWQLGSPDLTYVGSIVEEAQALGFTTRAYHNDGYVHTFARLTDTPLRCGAISLDAHV